jgi:hypothetical protein
VGRTCTLDLDSAIMLVGDGGTHKKMNAGCLW